MLAIEHIPFRLVVFLLLSSLTLLMLRLDCKFFELITIHFHVSSDYAVSYSCNRGIPVLVLAAMQQTFDYDGVSFCHVRLDKLLHQFRV